MSDLPNLSTLVDGQVPWKPTNKGPYRYNGILCDKKTYKSYVREEIHWQRTIRRLDNYIDRIIKIIGDPDWDPDHRPEWKLCLEVYFEEGLL